MTAKFNTRPATAADVRKHFRSDATAMAALSDDAQVTVREGARGRLHPTAIQAFNATRKPSQQYRERAPKTVEISYKHVTPSGSRTKRVFVAETEARALAGDLAGKRGPLSRKALAAAGEAFAKTL